VVLSGRQLATVAKVSFIWIHLFLYLAIQIVTQKVARNRNSLVVSEMTDGACFDQWFYQPVNSIVGSLIALLVGQKLCRSVHMPEVSEVYVCMSFSSK